MDVDLTFSQEQLTQDFLRILLTAAVDEFNLITQFVHPECRLFSIGKELSIPFAGEYIGPTAVSDFCHRFAYLFATAANNTDPIQVYATPTETCAHVTLAMQRSDSSNAAPVFWFLKSQFETHLIRSLELMYYTGVIVLVRREV